MGTYRGITIWETTPSYEQWCEDLKLNPDDDENYEAYCEWKANSR